MTYEPLDVAVVGAGPAGVGAGAALSLLDLDVRLLDRDGIGASFRNWPAETRMLTPSFPSGGWDLPDLNAIAPRAPPALALDTEHPTGKQYADYLERVAQFHDLDVETGVEVTTVEQVEDGTVAAAATDAAASDAVAVDGGTVYELETAAGDSIHSRTVVWAAGEFGTPRRDLEGAEHCTHYGDVDAWETLAETAPEGECYVIGGYESGIDAAVGLADAGRSVTVLDSGAPWAFRSPDPSDSLAPFTVDLLEEALDAGRIDLVPGARVERVTASGGSDEEACGAGEDAACDCGSPTANEGDAATRYELHVDPREVLDPDGEVPGEEPEERYVTTTPPILATGFEPTLGPVEWAFPRDEETAGAPPQLTDRDESPEAPGVFLAGPAVRHAPVSFCFVYKFRTRLPIVAETIGERLGVETEAMVEEYRDANMYVEDPSCCDPEECAC